VSEEASEREHLASRLNGLLTIIGVCCLIILTANIAWMVFGLGLDDTDNGANNRSGMQLHTDHGTGCQYLSSAGGSLTPRLNADGVPMCNGATP